MKITLRNMGATGAVKAVESTGQLAHVRLGLTNADIRDHDDLSILKLEFADRDTLTMALLDMLYAYGAPAFNQREWLDIANFVEAASLDVSDTARERAEHYAKQIRDAYGVKR